ncbi:tetratricopeptide repeat protein [Sphingobium sp. CCH11-B1]|uniref:tetratricopeptide repeat protein n=1 Tax=Sphingobium sp. CCH11-B1 TaxID=1768781 RepID=UPI000835DB73|nr:SPOR domain-containing protein [Sphingobium sp. CCH11-B1]
MTRTSFLIPGLVLLSLVPIAAQAQSDQSQLTRPLGAADLNSNLARLASNPRDIAAMIGAGEAALALDDPRAAAGFFARAEAIESGNGRVKAGLGRVMLKLQNPAEALRQFDQATRLGYPDATILSDRALAKDMTGDQAGAQRDYQAALARTPQDEELIRRYAASLGISGQVEAADKVLDPLLYKGDRAAWRYRAFIYAMNNKQADARKVALQTLPEQLATALTPYMQKMPYLTPAQKAAAVHFGHFPQQVGTSIAAIVPTPPAPGIVVGMRAPVTVAAAPTTAPAKPLSRAEQRRQQREAERLARAQARNPQQPARTPTQVAQATTTPPLAATRTPAPATTQPSASQTNTGQTSTGQTASAPAGATQPPAPQPQPTPSQPTSSQPPPASAQPTRTATAPAPTPSAYASATPAPNGATPAARGAVQGPPAPGFESMDMPARPSPSSSSPTPSQPAPAAIATATPPSSALPAATPAPSAPRPNPEATRTLADIIRAIDVPETERATSVAAVDLDEVATLQAQRRAERAAAAKAAADKAKKEAAAKAKAEADAKAKKEAEEKKRLAANPSRNWLQVGVGQSKSALGFTMKRLRGKYGSLAPQDAWSASWGRTNRLLVGPFSSFTRAKDLETKLRADGADVFAWKSDAGEVVEKLAGE